MKVSEFIQQIEQNPDLPVAFQYGEGQIVPGGYHVTEIKNAHYETIDCGNSLHTWDEVIVQVWVPEEAEADDAMMTGTKLGKIWGAVDSRLALKREAEIRIEYGDGYRLTASYHVDRISAENNQLTIHMLPPATQCKPRALLVPLNDGLTVLNNIANIACCTPAASVPQRDETVSPLPVKSGCC